MLTGRAHVSRLAAATLARKPLRVTDIAGRGVVMVEKRAPDPAPNAGGIPSARADGRRSRWTEHRAQRRAAFVAAGAAAIDRFGAEASAEQIADAAGVSRTVLYRYFRDREDLRQAIADQVATTVIDSVVPQLAVTANPPLARSSSR